MEDTNIGYWERVLKAPTPSYQELFDAEHKYLVENIPPESRVLDIGCGEGRNMKSILEVTPNVCGVDYDEVAVDHAKKNFDDLQTVEVLKGEAAHLPYKDETFDVVTFLMILPNLDQEKEQALQEAARVLRGDGFIILSTFAETALDERMRVYDLVKIPIKAAEKGRLVFENGVISEQFSLENIESLARHAGLKIVSHEKVNSLAYICKLVKV